VTALFALAASLLWGFSDFGGGLLAKRFPALTVVLASQGAAALLLGGTVAATGTWGAAGSRVWFAVAAGVIGPVALLCFYRALALGPMGVVSPLATAGVVVPVGAGLALGERPGPAQYAGIAVAVLGIAMAGGPELRGAPVQRRVIALTLVAALGFGTVMVLISSASHDARGLLPALFVQRVVNVTVGCGVLLTTRLRRAGSPPAADAAHASGIVGAGPGPRALVRAMPAVVFVGLSDVAANGGYALAARSGPVAVAAVLASLYPVVTALTARAVLGERLRILQAAGAGLAVAGSLLLAAG
jgi:drug/metabolite transporter (DMT)-like permease